MHKTLVNAALLIACLAIFEPAALADDPLKDRCESAASDGECALYGVSLIELIARPEACDGKQVRVIGYVRLEFEGNAIYISKESYEAGISKNALWLDPPASSSLTKAAAWGPRYAIVEGRFYAKNLGHMGMFSGSIVDTKRLDPWNHRP